MSRSISASAVSAAILGVVFISGSCSNGDGNGDVETQDASALSFFRTHGDHLHSGAGGAAFTGGVVNPGTGGAGSTGDFVDAGAGGAPASGAPTTGATATPPATPDVNAVIAAAQAPDGTAIPQGPGPNGQCPEVLVLLGFWSCPQIGQTCSYQASGVSHNCACDRLNGEGGLPAWVCDQ
jgi:hypothetical protein